MISKDSFDAALIPGFRHAVAGNYKRLREVEALTFNEVLDDASQFLAGTSHVRCCPLCGNASTDAEQLYRVHGMNIIRCKRCEFVYSRQVINRVRDEQRYCGTDVASANLALKSNSAYEALEARKAEYIVERATTFREPGRMLDIGCSTGKVLLAARKYGWSSIGIEANDHAASLAQHEGLDVIYGFFPDDMPQTKNTFSLITMLDVLEHVEEPVPLLEQVSARLQKDGILGIQVPNFESLLIRLEGESNNNLCQGHWSYFTSKTLNKVAEKAGFALLATETIISELDRVMAFPAENICKTVKTICGIVINDISEITPDWIHYHQLGYKVLAFYQKLG